MVEKHFRNTTSMKVNQKTKKTARIQVELDGDRVELPEEVEGSLVSIRAYLEFLALQNRRVLSGFVVDGIDLRQVSGGIGEEFESIQADTITFEQLSHRLVDTACRQLHRLSEEMAKAVLQVMINDRDPLYRQWKRWEPQFRNPLISLGFLRELWGSEVDDVKVGGHTLAEHLEELNPLLCEVDAIFLATEHCWIDEDAMALSAMLEEQLVPWLKMLEVYLLKLNALPLS